MLTEKLNLHGSPYNTPSFEDNESYPLQWEVGSAVNKPPDVTSLPCVEDARYLFNTVKFHLGQVYRLLDEKAFVTQMEEFYRQDASVEKADECRLWFAEFLLVLSLGNAFLSQSKHRKEPPGAKFFRRAMALMPDYGSFWKDSLISIDFLTPLALAGLYLYSLDHREAGQVYVKTPLLL
jgi:proline utilization trans-activator